MDLVDYLRALRKNWVLVVLSVLLGAGAGAGSWALSAPVYRADCLLFVSMHDTGGAASLMQGSVFTQQRVQSYTGVLTSPRVLQPVVDELGLDTTARDLAEHVGSSAPVGTVLIEVTVDESSPELAARVADSVAEHFGEVVSELERPSADAPSPVRVTVLRPAEVRGDPIAPQLSRDLALGLLCGLAAGTGLAVLREVLDTTVKTVGTITDLGAPALGATLVAPPGERPELVAVHARTPQSEAVRQIRTNLQFADVDHPPRVVVVTSAVPGEGKSTTAVNLALASAAAGVRTILVEADLRLPKAAQYLGVDGGAGLTTVLSGRADVDDVLQPYGDTGLSVLASGPVPVNPSALLGSRHMADLLERLRERADLVVVDSPPLLPVADAAVLARQTDGAIVVVRHGRTTRDHLTRALERLRAVDATVLGGVLSMVPARRSDFSYSYDYGYGYQPEPSAEAEPSLAER
ncbi:polysaccharide biosynthesis tyrosine autokinase [Kineococcus indalonis]|uniref:polysaccharide biosynthesis tyrosine autokinase n=1 Tax=Kineococcus indalonis TaxID=2696566 RepID=UPI001412DDF5|nr:polysaccharide biosynthesis tyrosine autokinase [Kineococcus indalonis]NAZ87546.1 polysaccharide biosynthesis tyrosine autokinase [Kineococcus indalonis]